MHCAALQQQMQQQQQWLISTSTACVRCAALHRNSSRRSSSRAVRQQLAAIDVLHSSVDICLVLCNSPLQLPHCSQRWVANDLRHWVHECCSRCMWRTKKKKKQQHIETISSGLMTRQCGMCGFAAQKQATESIRSGVSGSPTKEKNQKTKPLLLKSYVLCCKSVATAQPVLAAHVLHR
jgi:hypothetical protein